MKQSKVTNLLIFFYFLIAIPVNAELIEQWAYRYGWPDSVEAAYAVAVDTSGYIYAAGSAPGNGTSNDFVVIKVEPGTGNEEWLYRYDGPANGFDEALSIIVDTSSGNIYAAGFSEGSGTDDDFTVVKLLPDGTEDWVYTYNGSGNGQDWASVIAVDASGNIYAAGHSEEIGTGSDFTVIKLSPAGPPEEWVYTHNGAGSGDDRADAIAIDTSGDIYVAGSSVGSGTGDDFTVIKLSPDGSEVWPIPYIHNGSADGADFVLSIAIGPLGNVHAAGYTRNTSVDYIVIKLSPDDGSELWSFIDDPFGGPDYATAVAVDTAGYIYSTGMVATPVGGADFAIYKLPPTGPPYEWAKAASTGGWDTGRTIAVGSLGIYVGGFIEGFDENGGKFIVYRGTPDGSTWDGYVYADADTYAMAKSIALDTSPDGSEYIYAAGRTYGGSIGFFQIPDFIVVKLKQPPIGIEEKNQISNVKCQMPRLEVCPNPFSKKTEIRFTNYDLRSTMIRIYDATGRLVKNFNLPTPGVLRPTPITWQGDDDFGYKLPAGVYFIFLKTQDEFIAKKIIKLK